MVKCVAFGCIEVVTTMNSRRVIKLVFIVCHGMIRDYWQNGYMQIQDKIGFRLSTLDFVRCTSSQMILWSSEQINSIDERESSTVRSCQTNA